MIYYIVPMSRYKYVIGPFRLFCFTKYVIVPISLRSVFKYVIPVKKPPPELETLNH